MAFNDPNKPLVSRLFATDNPPKQRIEIKSAPDNSIEFYSGDALETAPGFMKTLGTELIIKAPDTVNFQGGSIAFQGGATFYDAGFGGIKHEFNQPIVSDLMAPVQANDNNNDLSAQTNSTAYVALVGSAGPQPNPFNTVPFPASGRVMVHISCDMSPSNAGGVTLTSFQLRDGNVGGAVIQGVSDTFSILYQADAANGRANFGASFYVENIVANTGVIYFQMLHRVVNAATIGTFRRRRITVQPLV